MRKRNIATQVVICLGHELDPGQPAHELRFCAGSAAVGEFLGFRQGPGLPMSAVAGLIRHEPL